MAVALLALGISMVQAQEEPPPELPAGARLPADAINLGSVAISFGEVGVLGGRGGSSALVSTTTRPSVAEARPAAVDIPERPPAGSRLDSVPVVFSEAGLSFPSSAVSLTSAPAGLGTGAADLSVRDEGRGRLRFTLSADVLFDFDKSDLRREANEVLARLMTEMNSRVPGGARLTVEGHTDWIGSDAYNDRLSTRRARSVKAWLTQVGGVPGSRVLTVGFGERRPVAPNAKPDGSDDPEGRQKNRRVEILVAPL